MPENIFSDLMPKDVDTNNPFSDLMKPPEESSWIRRGIGDPLVGLARGTFVGIPEAVTGLADIPTLGLAGKTTESIGRNIGIGGFKEGREFFDQMLTPETRQAQQEVADTKGFLPTIGAALERPSVIAQTVAESIPSMVGGGGAVNLGAKLLGRKIAPTVAGGLAEGLVTAGQNIEQVRQQTPDQLLTGKQVAIGTASGALTGVLGVLGGKLADYLKIADPNTMAAMMTSGGVAKTVAQQQTWKKSIVNLLKTAVKEGLLEELPQSFQEQVAQNLSLGKPLDEGAYESAAMGMLAGMAQGAGAHVIQSVIQKRLSTDPTHQEIEKQIAEVDTDGQLQLQRYEAARARVEPDRVGDIDGYHWWDENGAEGFVPGSPTAEDDAIARAMGKEPVVENSVDEPTLLKELTSRISDNTPEGKLSFQQLADIEARYKNTSIAATAREEINRRIATANQGKNVEKTIESVPKEAITEETVKTMPMNVLGNLEREYAADPVISPIIRNELQNRYDSTPAMEQRFPVKVNKPIDNFEKVRLKMAAKEAGIPFEHPYDIKYLTIAEHEAYKKQQKLDKVAEEEDIKRQKAEATKEIAQTKSVFHQTMSSLPEGSALKYILDSIKKYGLGTEDAWAGKTIKNGKLVKEAVRQKLAGHDLETTKEVRAALTRFGFPVSEGMTRKGKYKLDTLAEELNSNGVEMPSELVAGGDTHWNASNLVEYLRTANPLKDKSKTGYNAEVDYIEKRIMEEEDAKLREIEQVNPGAIINSQRDIQAPFDEETQRYDPTGKTAEEIFADIRARIEEFNAEQQRKADAFALEEKEPVVGEPIDESFNFGKNELSTSPAPPTIQWVGEGATGLEISFKGGPVYVYEIGTQGERDRIKQLLYVQNYSKAEEELRKYNSHAKDSEPTIKNLPEEQRLNGIEKIREIQKKLNKPIDSSIADKKGEKNAGSNIKSGEGRLRSLSESQQKQKRKLDANIRIIGVSGGIFADKLVRAAREGKETLIIDTEAGKNKWAAPAVELGRQNGHEVIFITDTLGTLNAFVNKRTKTIFVSVNQSKNALQLVGHELSHVGAKGHASNEETQKIIDPNSKAAKDYQRGISEARGVYNTDGSLHIMPMEDVLVEYAADLQGGFGENYGVTLSEGLKKVDTTHGKVDMFDNLPVEVDVIARGPTYQEVNKPSTKTAHEQTMALMSNHDKKQVAFGNAIKEYEQATGKKFLFWELTERLDKLNVEVSYDTTKMTNRNAFAEYNSKENTIYVNPKRFRDGKWDGKNKADFVFESEMAFNAVMAIADRAEKSRDTIDTIRFKSDLTKFRQTLEPFAKTASPEAKRLYDIVKRSDVKNMMGFVTNPEFAGWLNSIPDFSPRGSGANMWGRIKDIVLKFVGKVSLTGKTKLDKLNEILDRNLSLKKEDYTKGPNQSLSEARKYDTVKAFLKATSYTNTYDTKFINGMKVYVFRNKAQQEVYEPVNLEQGALSGWNSTRAIELQRQITELQSTANTQDTEKGRAQRFSLLRKQQELKRIVQPYTTANERLEQIWNTAHGVTAAVTKERLAEERQPAEVISRPVEENKGTGTTAAIRISKESAGFTITNRKKTFVMGEKSPVPEKKETAIETLRDKGLQKLADKLVRIDRGELLQTPESVHDEIRGAVQKMYPAEDYADYLPLRAATYNDVISAAEETIVNKPTFKIDEVDQSKLEKERLMAEAFNDRTTAQKAGMRTTMPVKAKETPVLERTEATNEYILRRGGVEIGTLTMNIEGDTAQIESLDLARKVHLPNVLASIFRDNKNIKTIKIEIKPMRYVSFVPISETIQKARKEAREQNISRLEGIRKKLESPEVIGRRLLEKEYAKGMAALGEEQEARPAVSTQSKETRQATQELGALLVSQGGKFNFTLDGNSEYVLDKTDFDNNLEILQEARKNYEAPVSPESKQQRTSNSFLPEIFEYLRKSESPVSENVRVLSKRGERGFREQKEESSIPSLDSINTYMDSIKRSPLLSAAEEKSLAENTDRKSKDRLINSNLRFVVDIAHKYKRFGARLSDLIQEGNIGLMKAVDRFDPSRGLRMTTYANPWIHDAMKSYIRDNKSLLKYGTTQTQRKLFSKVGKAKQELINKLGRVPDYAEIAEFLGVKEAEVLEADVRLGGEVDLDAETADGTMAQDFLTDREETIERTIRREEARNATQKTIDSLSDIHKFIVQNHVLTDAMTYEEIGKKYGYTKVRIKQLEMEALEEIRLRTPNISDLSTSIAEAQDARDIIDRANWHEIRLPRTAKDLEKVIKGDWFKNPQNMPKEEAMRMRNTISNYGGIQYKNLRKIFSLPYQNAQKSSDWKSLYKIFGVERVENREKLSHEWFMAAEPYLNRRQYFKKEGYTKTQIKTAENNIGRLITIGDENLRNVLFDLRDQIASLSAQIKKSGPLFDNSVLESKKTALETKLALLEKERAYSFADIQDGLVKDFDGSAVKLTGPKAQLEYDMYKAVRNTEDRIFKAVVSHSKTMLMNQYSKQKWYKLLNAVIGEGGFNEVQLSDIVEKLQGASAGNIEKVTAKGIVVKLNDIFKKINSEYDSTKGENILDTYEKISKNISSELTQLREYISALNPQANRVELDKAVRDMFVAYQRTKPRLKKLRDLRNNWNDWPGFFPRKREQGSMKMQMFESYADSKTGAIKKREVFSQMFNSPQEAQTMYGELLDRYGKKIDGKVALPDKYTFEYPAVSKTNEGSFEGMKDFNLQALLDSAFENMQATGNQYYDVQGKPVDLKGEVWDAAFDAIAGQFQSRGAMAHGIHRKQKAGEKAIKGYLEEGHDQILIDHITAMSGVLTKQVAAYDAMEAMSNLDDKTRAPELREYISGQLRNDTEMDRMSSKFRSMAFLWYLGGMLKSSVVNMTQPIIVGIPLLGNYMRGKGIKGSASIEQMKASTDITKNAKMLMQDPSEWQNLEGLTDAERQYISESIISGNMAAQHIRFIKGQTSGWGRLWNNTFDTLALPFASVEKFNRVTSGLAMFRISYAYHMKNKGTQSNDDIIAQATEDANKFINDVHYPIGKHNLPILAQSGDLAGVVLKTAYTFRTFTHNFLLNQFNLLRSAARLAGKTDAEARLQATNDLKTFIHTMALLAVFGGLMGLPFLKDIFDWYEEKFGSSPKEWVRQTLRGMGGQTLETIGMGGIPAILGGNISGSLAIGVPFIGDQTALESIGGVYAGLGKKLRMAGEAAVRGDAYRVAANMTPEFLRGPIVALTESDFGKQTIGTRGVATTPQGLPSYSSTGQPLSYTGGEAIWKGLGFQPTRIAKEREIEQSVKTQIMWANEKKKQISESYRIDKLQNNKEAMKTMMDSVRQLNTKISERKIPVPKANISTIIKASRETKNLQKRRELARRAELAE